MSGRQAQRSDDSAIEFLKDVIVRDVPRRVGLLSEVYKGRKADRVSSPHPLALCRVQVGLARRKLVLEPSWGAPGRRL